MTTSDKRQPAYTDTDLMPFGKHKGDLLQDVPARYLAWLWGELKADGYHRARQPHEIHAGLPVKVQVKIKLANYIWNSQDAIAQETGDTLG